MKKIQFKIFITLLSLSLVILMGFYTIDQECEGNLCAPGDTIDWKISIDNQGEEKMEIQSLEIREAFNDSIIALWNTSFFPLSDYRGDLFVIPAEQKKTLTITSSVPPPNNGSYLFYYLCFINAVKEPQIVRNNIYTITYCYKHRLEAMPIIECKENSSCKNEETCIKNQCVLFNCSDCQFVSLHECIDYDCCNQEDCNSDRACIKHKCIELNCSYEEVFINNSCRKLECNFDQVAIDHRCINLNCTDDEYILDHSCVRLNCSEEEYVFDHSCVRLNCSEEEYVFDHSCVKLDCKDNETLFNHSCQQLNCNFFQIIDTHDCTLNFPLVKRMIIELVVIMIIVMMITLDLRRYFKKKKLAKKDS